MEIIEAWIAKRKAPNETKCSFCKSSIKRGDVYIRYFITFKVKDSFGMSPLVVCLKCAEDIFGKLVESAKFTEPLFLPIESNNKAIEKMKELAEIVS